MADEFLHGIDINVLKSELNMDVADIAKLAGISENGIYKWSWTKEKQGTRPSFNALVKLLEKGASTETLFGVSTNTPAAKYGREYFDGGTCPVLLRGREEPGKSYSKVITSLLPTALANRSSIFTLRLDFGSSSLM